MDTQIAQPTVDTSQLFVIQQKLALDSKIRSGIGWFFWIAGLSLINSVVFFLGASFTFVAGLGVTQVIDGFLFGFTSDLGSEWQIVRFIGLFIDIIIAAVFVVFGVLGRKHYRIPVIIGMVLYALDAVILLLFQDFLGAGFHAFALFGIWGGLKGISGLANLEKLGNTETIESIRQRMPTFQPELTPRQNRSRMILSGLFVLAILLIFLVVFFQK
jgi:hypothetical protein